MSSNDVFDNPDKLVYTGLNPNGNDSVKCPRCQRELFDEDGVIDCAYDDCPNLSEYSGLMGLDGD